MFRKRGFWFAFAIAALFIIGRINAQLQQSGGAGSNASVGSNAATPPTSSTMAGGSVTTAAPSYTTGQMDKLSLNTAGGLRVDGSGVTQPVSISGNQAVNVAQMNGVTPLMGNGVTGTGSTRVTVASDNTPFVVKTVPIHGCAGNTVQDIQQVDVATGAGSNLTTADTCVFWISVNNKTASPVTATIQDRAGTPVVYSTTFSVPPNSDVLRQYSGKKFTTGVTVISGTASALNAFLMGVQ